MSQTRDDTPGGQAVNVEEIMARVRAEIDARNGQGATPDAQLVGAGIRRSQRGLHEDIYRSLHQAKLMSGSVYLDYNVGYRTPIIGQAWAIVRRRIHQEIRVYTDALMRQQTSFNSHLVRALSSLVENLDAFGLRERIEAQRTQEAEIAELRTQVAALQGRVHELEGRLARIAGPQ